MRPRALPPILLAVVLAAASGCGLIGSVQPEPSSSPAAVPKNIEMPAIIGKRLTEATAILKSHGLNKLVFHDVTGRERVVIEPNNWLVKKQAPAAGTKVARDTEITLDVSKPTDGVGPSSVRVGVLPDVRCMELQGAQDKLQEAGFLVLSSKDALGDRRQILDRDWVVIGQAPAPGHAALPTTPITLTVVKYGEPTGDSGCAS
jgi:beta-lactam-binding protein with PASTA domain